MAATVYDIPLKRIDGEPARLRDYSGKVLLLVNVASKCGLTPQYAALEQLYQTRRAQGLEVLGFPANNFMGQEPGSDTEIQAFCSTQYDVHFPLFAKISVVGVDQHPLYAQLTQAQPKSSGDGPFREGLKAHGINAASPMDVLWNFEKFIVSRRGEVVARFAPDVTAEDPRLLATLDAELVKSA